MLKTERKTNNTERSLSYKPKTSGSMEFTRRYLPMEWEERWRREKERRKKVMEEGGEEFERESKKLTWIKAYNDSRMGMREKEDVKNERMKEWPQKYTKDSYPTEIFQAMEELRCCSVLTDLTLSVKHGITIHAHSLVLAAVSSLIQDMLQQRKEKNQRERCLCVGPEVSDLGLSAVLEFAYTGNIAGLNVTSLPQIQAAAQYLRVPRVLELCKEEEKDCKKGVRKNRRKTIGEEHRKVNLQCIRQLWEERVGCDVDLEAEGRTFDGEDTRYHTRNHFVH